MSARPYVICHMVPSIDGRIVTTRWDLPATLSQEYERTAGTFDADAWMIGRISMEPYAGRARVPPRRRGPPIPRTDFVARRSEAGYAIALDPSGKLRWESGSIDDEHVVTVLGTAVSDDYLAFLQSKRVSYLFGGDKALNLRRVLEKLAKHFGIEKLLLEGGGTINGSFLTADLVDEVSVLVAPVADGGVGVPTLFDVSGPSRRGRRLKLVSVQKRKGDLVWLRYRRRRS
jgi:riboflavin biosynthesis pyrimidine reductase